MNPFLPFLVATCIAPVLLAQEQPQIEAKARTLMNASVRYLQSLERFEMDYTLRAQGNPAPGQEIDDRFASHVALEKPGSFAKIGRGEQGPMSPPSLYLFADTGTILMGDQAIVVNNINGLRDFFTRRDLGYIEEINLLLPMDLRADLLRAFLTYHAEVTWEQNLQSAEYIGEETLGEHPAHHLRLKYVRDLGPEKMTVINDIWLARGEQPLLLQVKEIMENDFSAMVLTGTYANWKVNEPIQVSIFKAPIQDMQIHPDYETYMQAANASPAEALVGTEAADFTLERLDGSTFTLSEQRGKQVVILDFWATWCGPCVEALPELMAATKKYQDKDVILVAVNQQEGAKRVSRFLQKQGWTLDVVLDGEGKTGSLYKVQGIPQTVIVGKDGNIKVVHVGSVAGMRDIIARDLDRILAE